jgi:alkylated DNA repair dioxygenase AlkB
VSERTAPAWLAPEPVVERVALGDGRSWVDVVRGLVPDGERVHDELKASVRWEQGKVFRYERWIEEPRMGGFQRADERHPALVEVGRWLGRRYGVPLDGPGLAMYRDERDSVGWHRDRELRYLDDTVIGILSLGQARSFLVRPLTDTRMDHDDPTDVLDFRPRSGDVVVMGGRCQAAYLHAVPKSPHGRCASRISAQWRWTSRTGRRDTNPGYYAPRRFSR